MAPGATSPEHDPCNSRTKDLATDGFEQSELEVPRDAVVLPGGQINPDLLRVEPKALAFIKDVFNQKKIVAAVCHAPWLLIETGIARGRRMTSYKSIKTDVINAGAKWEDSMVVVDDGVITSRNPDDLDAFSAKIVEEVKDGRHTKHSAA